MKVFYKLITLCCLFFSITSYAQIEGKCLDTYGKGIPYVNISVKGKPIGQTKRIKSLVIPIDIQDSMPLFFSFF